MKKLPKKTTLPPKNQFYNELTDEDYAYAQTIWNACKMRYLGNFHDFYVRLDVLLHGDIFENFRRLCLQSYEIDPTHVYTAAGLSRQICLKMTKVQLELLTDIDMLLFIEKGVRGGVCQISQRYSKANKKYMENYSPEEDSTYIAYLDVNNLYGWAMSQHLPRSEFHWVDISEITEDFILTSSDTDEHGYILDVDLY